MKRQIKLLFVDDEEKFLKGMTERLKLRDLMVHSFNNGPDALAAAKKETYDVALLDLKMPGIDGIEVLRRVKKDHPNVEVVILTGHGYEEDERTCTELGAFTFLRKPVDIDTLSEALKAAYQQARERKEKLSDGSDDSSEDGC